MEVVYEKEKREQERLEYGFMDHDSIFEII